MGRYAERLHRKMASAAHNLPTEEPQRRPGELLPGGVKDIPTLIKEGHNPFHAVYVFMQNLTARFAECAAQMPEIEVWARAVEEAEEEYMPSGPPMSPLTGSFFWMWALYDLRIGKSTDTLAYCQIAVNDILLLNDHQLDALKKMEGSRMGIYEHVGMTGPHIRLRELITNNNLTCHCPAGYTGKKGELWYVRLLPPLEPDHATYWIAMTTPYVLIGSSKAEWVAYLKRAMVQSNGSNDASRLHDLLKYGPEPNYWNEFVLKSYHHHQYDAVFLTGIPDMEATLPHA